MTRTAWQNKLCVEAITKSNSSNRYVVCNCRPVISFRPDAAGGGNLMFNHSRNEHLGYSSFRKSCYLSFVE